MAMLETQRDIAGRRPFCKHAATVFMLVDGDETCIPCAAQLYELTLRPGLLSAWLLEHGKNLDNDANGLSIPQARA